MQSIQTVCQVRVVPACASEYDYCNEVSSEKCEDSDYCVSQGVDGEDSPVSLAPPAEECRFFELEVCGHCSCPGSAWMGVWIHCVRGKLLSERFSGSAKRTTRRSIWPFFPWPRTLLTTSSRHFCAVFLVLLSLSLLLCSERQSRYLCCTCECVENLCIAWEAFCVESWLRWKTWWRPWCRWGAKMWDCHYVCVRRHTIAVQKHDNVEDGIDAQVSMVNTLMLWKDWGHCDACMQRRRSLFRMMIMPMRKW